MGNLVLLCRGKDFLVLDLTHTFNFFLYTFVVWFLGNCRLLLSLRSSETVSFCSLIIVLPLQIYIVQQRSLFSLQGLHTRSDKVSLRFNSKPMDSHTFAKIKFWLSCLSDGLNKFSKEGSLSHTAFRLLLQNLHVSLALAFLTFLPAFLQIVLALT